MPVAASIVLGYAGVGEASIELILKTIEEILIAVDTHKHVGCPVPFDDDGRTVALGSTAAVRPLLSSLSELRTNSISLMVFDGPRQDTGQVRASVDACSKVMATDLPWPDMFPRISFRMHALPRNMPNMSSQEAYTGRSIDIHANRRFRLKHHAQAKYIRLPFSPFPASLTVW